MTRKKSRNTSGKSSKLKRKKSSLRKKPTSSKGWFTKEDAKKITEEVIGRFYDT